MGIDVRLEDEDAAPIGEAVLDVNNHLQASLSADGVGGLIRHIDAYGETLFNRLQIPVVVSELEALQGRVRPEYRFQVAQAIALLREAIDKPHVYARFIGD